MSKGIKIITHGFVALMICAPAAAQSSKLNAPISQRPTVGSEIDRGQEIGFECGLHNISDRAKLVGCVNDAIMANKQKATLSEPFEFGLYVRSLQNSYALKVPMNSDPWIPIWRDRLTKIMKSNKLSFKDFCEAVGTINCDTTKINEQTYGTAVPVRR